MNKQLRSREQTAGLSAITKNFLKDCPPEYTKLRALVEKYHTELLTLKIETKVS